MSRPDPHSQRQDGDDPEMDGESWNHRDTNSPQQDADERRRDDSVSYTRYPYPAIGAILIGIGAVFSIGAVVLDATAVLFVLGGIGLFSGVLTYYLGIDRFITADLGEQIHAATMGNYEGICADLDLSDRRVYVPQTNPKDRDTETDFQSNIKPRNKTQAVRLYVPKQSDIPLREIAWLDLESFVVRNESEIVGLSIRPTGEGLFFSVLSMLDKPLADEPQELSQQLAEAVVEEFGLAQSLSSDIDIEHQTMEVQFSDPLYENCTRFDHPLISLFAVALAVGLDSPVETISTNHDPLTATFRW